MGTRSSVRQWSKLRAAINQGGNGRGSQAPFRAARLLGSPCGRRRIIDDELHRAVAGPAVGTEMAGNVEAGAVAVEQGAADRRVERAEGDRLEASAAGAVADCAADM